MKAKTFRATARGETENGKKDNQTKAMKGEIGLCIALHHIPQSRNIVMSHLIHAAENSKKLALNITNL